MSVNTQTQDNGWRREPMYSFSEVARLADVSAGTVRNWLFGYSTGDREAQPLFRTPPNQGPMVSFLQLIEIVVAARFRKVEHASFRTVYQAYQNARLRYPDYEYPFAHLELRAIGGHIIHFIHDYQTKDSLQTLDQLQQWTLPGIVQQVIDQLDYDLELAARWWPDGKDVPIVIDPRISSGVPTIVGRGVTVSTIHKRFTEGRLSIDFIAEDLRLERLQVEHAIRWGRKLAA